MSWYLNWKIWAIITIILIILLVLITKFVNHHNRSIIIILIVYLIIISALSILFSAILSYCNEEVNYYQEGHVPDSFKASWIKGYDDAKIKVSARLYDSTRGYDMVHSYHVDQDGETLIHCYDKVCRHSFCPGGTGIEHRIKFGQPIVSVDLHKEGAIIVLKDGTNISTGDEDKLVYRVNGTHGYPLK